MKITSLIENTSSREDISAEHGLSLFVETKNHKLLFDMGQTDLFAANAEKLGIDLTEADAAVLSHGHYDHGGGLAHFLEINRTAPVYLSPYAFEPHYNGQDKYIGLDTGLQENSRLITVPDVFSICDGMTLYSCNGDERKHDLGSAGLTVMEEGQLVPDDFRHEQYLLIEEDGKKILISGCSHKGILNIADLFSPDILIGGFHFSKFPCDDTLASYAKYLDSFDTLYYTCHCTGTEQYEFMKKHMKNLRYLASGDILEI